MYFEVACRLASVNARIGLHIVSLATLIYLSNSENRFPDSLSHCNSIHTYPYTIGSSNLLLSIDTRVDLLRGLFKRSASRIDIQKLLCRFRHESAPKRLALVIARGPPLLEILDGPEWTVSSLGSGGKTKVV